MITWVAWKLTGFGVYSKCIVWTALAKPRNKLFGLFYAIDEF
jgi:hypothetical protein